jgi:hypothetical protein
MVLVEPAQFASYIKQDPQAWDSTRAQLCLDGAAGAVTEYCGWHIAPAITEDAVVDGSGTLVQPLPTLNLTALNTIAENGHVLDPGHIDWSANGLLEKRFRLPWTGRRRGIAVSITHGYPETPSWVVTLICAVAARGFITTPGIIAEAAGGEAVTYASSAKYGLTPPGSVALTPIEKKMLDRIRIPLAA